MTWHSALLLATALHAGLQLTVSVAVYPALSQIPPASWRGAHSSHWSRVVPLYASVYVLAALATVGLLLTERSAAAWVSSGGTAASIGITLAFAIPLHRRLDLAPDLGLLGRLRTFDLLRTLGALVALTGAVLAGA